MSKSLRLSDLKPEYQQLWTSATIRDSWQDRANEVAKAVQANQARYEVIQAKIGVPWWFVGGLHNMECGLDFSQCLHNGEPFNQVTTLEPSGRGPFDSWEDAAIDALTLKDFHHTKDRSIAAWLWRAELFNGFGYRMKDCLTPYLWSGTQHYTSGKYVADGRYDPDAVSQQVGVAAIWKTLGITEPDAAS